MKRKKLNWPFILKLCRQRLVFLGGCFRLHVQASLHAQLEHRGGGGGKQKMADGVDHIDIYADVEEEFNQVRFTLNI